MTIMTEIKTFNTMGNTMSKKLTAMLAGLAFGAASLIATAVQAVDIKAAVILPGLVNDKSFNQNVFEGIEKIKKDLGVEAVYSEKVPQPSQVEVMSDYARRGYNVIVGAGAEYTDAAKRVASQFPDAKVVVLNGAPVEGVATINFENEQFGYVLGLAAGRMSKSGTVGALSAQQVPAFDQIVAGYRAGVEAGNPSGKVLVAYTNDWSDIAKAKEASLNMISQGADVILPYLDGGFLGVVQAAKQRTVHVVGVVADLSGPYPEENLLSTILDFGGALYMAVDMAKKGELQPHDYRFGIGTEAGKLGGFNPAVSAEVKADVEKAIAAMKDGSLKPGAAK